MIHNKKILNINKNIEEKYFHKILTLIFDRLRINFNFYKQNSIRRRIVKRMVFLEIDSFFIYYKKLKKDTNEISKLSTEILIHFTQFFRDPYSFKALEKKLFPKLKLIIKKRKKIRIWVPACSTGEEPYSILILLLEYLKKNKLEIPIQIFATDLSDEVLAVARKGIYSLSAVKKINKKYLKLYFDFIDNKYKIKKEVRKNVIFSKHNIIEDPSFSKIDFISCRNLFIYFNTNLQRKIVSIFNYSLLSDGMLWLGKSENCTNNEDYFKVIDKKNKIYSKNIILKKNHSKTLSNYSNILKKKKLTNNKNSYLVKIEELKNDILKGNKYRDILSHEFESSFEDITLGNEELQSNNEELLSTNEELETAKEELIAVNGELQQKNSDLISIMSDLNNILTTVDLPLIIVGRDLKIRRFTPKALLFFNLIHSDIGRPIFDIVSSISIDLNKLIKKVIRTSIVYEEEIQNKNFNWYRLQIRPCLNSEKKIDSIILLFVDITILKENLFSSENALKYAISLTDSIQIPFLVLDLNKKIRLANYSFYKYFKTTSEEIKSEKIFKLFGNHLKKNKKLFNMLDLLIKNNKHFDHYEIEYLSEKAGKRVLVLSGKQIESHKKSEVEILLLIEDITESKEISKRLKESESLFRLLANALPHFSWMTKSDGKVLWYNQRFYDYTGMSFNELEEFKFDRIIHPDHIDRVLSFLKSAWNKNEPWEITFPLKSKAGQWRWFLTRAVPIHDSEGLLVHWFGTNTDITEQLQTQIDLKNSESALIEALRVRDVLFRLHHMNS